MPGLDSKTTRIMRKIHRWGGLLLAAFIIFYCITGILLNHRGFFDYFVFRKKTAYQVPASDIELMKSFVEFYKGQINRSDDPVVIRIREGRTIEFLYGSHGKTTYIINPEEGTMLKIEKEPRQPLYWLNNLHKAFKTSNFWVLLSDIASVVIVAVTVTGLVIMRYRMVDYIMLFGGILILAAGAILS
ncbi:MAG: hypothetical protein GXO94_08090 [Nitrospirae bacterium]|nr:hypothetical protein [Nitrospirota bacterium]